LDSPKDEEHPVYLSEVVFRDLVCRASYGNIKSVLKPALMWVKMSEIVLIEYVRYPMTLMVFNATFNNISVISQWSVDMHSRF
jgi:hypothetical protein